MDEVAQSVPAFQRIKEFLLHEIQQGRWQAGDLIPSETALTRQFGVARMTVNRAVRELTNEQVLVRKQGLGTYVAQPKYQATLLEIKSIADEIRMRGHAHSSALLCLDACEASLKLAREFALGSGAPLFHSRIVHMENGLPIQVEERWVNPALAPDYLQQDFSHSTPNEYLMRVAPLQAAHYRIEAMMPPAEVAQWLQMPASEPCLVLHRQTLALGQVASIATMWHPASRYQFAGSVGPGIS
ncbi:histidine utilization repressor [Massilia sp. W12]|uniref:histidine utilization repressor n=1 Tax=Massilia sp. W12 TaxID=3126507 RepID=UPI0030D2147C